MLDDSYLWSTNNDAAALILDGDNEVVESTGALICSDCQVCNGSIVYETYGWHKQHQVDLVLYVAHASRYERKKISIATACTFQYYPPGAPIDTLVSSFSTNRLVKHQWVTATRT